MPVNLKSKSSRAALEPRREPYWNYVRKGLYLGYRRLAEGDGTWIGRQLQAGSKKYLLRSFGCLPGHDEALKALEAWANGVDLGATHKATSVQDACAAYVQHQKAHASKANAADAEGRFRRLIDDKPIGMMPLDKLRPAQLNAWLAEQQDDDGDEDELRRSKDTANRNWTALRAALNMALRNRLVATDGGWATVTPFSKAGRRRERFLTFVDRTALLARCEPALAALATALMLTAARPGEIVGCSVGDFDAQRGTLALSGKTGRRLVTLSTAAVAFLRAQAASKLPSAPLLSDGFGNRWNKDAWKKPFKAAVVAAGLPQDVVMYTLRHTGISEMIAGGVDTFLIAKLAGTSTAMIDQHYGHLRHEQTRARLDAVVMV